MTDKYKLLPGGRWNEGRYNQRLSISMSYKEEMPNIIKLSSELGQLKSIVETELIKKELIKQDK